MKRISLLIGVIELFIFVLEIVEWHLVIKKSAIYSKSKNTKDIIHLAPMEGKILPIFHREIWNDSGKRISK
jgi:hypothetical protein